MKKIIITLGLFALLLAGCGSDKETTASPNEENQSNKVENNDEISQTESTVDTQKEIKVEVTDHVFYRWVNESTGGTENVTVYAAIQNTGSEVVNVAQTKVTYLNSNGEVIATIDANSFYTNLMPSMIGPGDVAYLALEQEVGDEFSDLKEIQVDVNPMVDEYTEMNKLSADKVNIVNHEQWGLSVTGFLKNEMGTPTTTVEASAGLFDKDGNFLGAIMFGSDDQTTVQGNDQTSFELDMPYFPNDQIDNVEEVEISAISLELK